MESPRRRRIYEKTYYTGYGVRTVIEWMCFVTAMD
jgi:hypothetical protein